MSEGQHRRIAVREVVLKRAAIGLSRLAGVVAKQRGVARGETKEWQDSQELFRELRSLEKKSATSQVDIET